MVGLVYFFAFDLLELNGNWRRDHKKPLCFSPMNGAAISSKVKLNPNL